jgi:hypothetical protein
MRGARATLLLAGVLACAGTAEAADPTAAECVAANESGQALQRSNHLGDARASFTKCTASSCPGLVRQDCAQKIEELTRLTPTVIFAVTDASGNDLVNVRVRAGDKVLTERLDGNAITLDPGEQHLTFESSGFTPLEKAIVVRVTEKDRIIKAALSPAAQEPVARPVGAPPNVVAALPSAPEPASGRSSGPSGWTYVSLGAGAAGLIVGGVFSGLWAQAKSQGDTACGTPGSCDMTTADQWESKQRSLSAGAITGFAVAAVGAGLGLALWIGTRNGSTPSRVGAAWLERGVVVSF